MKPPSPHNSEWLTRKQFIDGKLEAAGWKIVPLRAGASVAKYERCAVEEYETANGPASLEQRWAVPSHPAQAYQTTSIAFATLPVLGFCCSFVSY